MGHLYEYIDPATDEVETRECGDEGRWCDECFEKEAARHGIQFGAVK